MAALVSWVGHRGVELSADNRYYSQYFELLGLRTGRWEELPPVAGVTLKLYAHMGSGPAPSRTSWATWDTSGVRYQKLVLLLSLQGSATGLVLREFATDELAAARQAA